MFNKFKELSFDQKLQTVFAASTAVFAVGYLIRAVKS
jgi:hypothetical protein